jgi:hypothetical protein
MVPFSAVANYLGFIDDEKPEPSFAVALQDLSGQ